MATLIQLIEDITEEDIYYNTLNSLRTTTATMQRGDPIREVLTEMLDNPRPHDMIDWSGKDDPLKPLIGICLYQPPLIPCKTTRTESARS